MKSFKVFSRQHSAKAKIPGYKIRPFMTEKYGASVRETLYETGYEMAKRPLGYVDSVKDIDSIRRITKFAIREYGVKIIYIDYLGLCLPSRNFRGSRYERASSVSEKCKELAQELNIPVVGLVQLRRKYKEEKKKGDAEGNDIEPTLDMLKESGSYENDADTIIFLWGEKNKEGEMEALRHIYGRCAKQRQGYLFPFEMKFAPSIFKFSSMEQINSMRDTLREVDF